MRRPLRVPLAGLAGLLIAAACSDFGPLDPASQPAPSLAASAATPSAWISEFHYDNDGTDVGEFIEIMGVAGTDLSGWSVVLYNGSNGAVYGTQALTSPLTTVCSGYGVTVIDYPSNGIQNGAPDGIALVDGSGGVVSFISYEGAMTAVGGPADGMTSEDVGVAETSSTPVGHSVQRGTDGVWQAPAPETRGACNGDAPGGSDPPPPPADGDVFISELHYDNDGTDAGEAVELTGPAGTDLTGWSIVFYNGNGGGAYSTAGLSGTLTDQCDGFGTAVVNEPGIQNGAPDGVALVDGTGTVIEFISYEGSFAATDGPASGMTSVDIGVAEGSSTPVGHSLQKVAGIWQEAAANSFGACNGGSTPPPTGATTVIIHELMGDPVSANSASFGEWFEVHNYGTAAVNLQGWTIASGGQPAHQIASSVIIPAGEYAVLGRDDNTSRNGGVSVAYDYYVGETTIWLDSQDWLVLRDGAGATVDSVAWTALPEGATRGVRNPSSENANGDGSNWGYSTTTFGAGDYGTPNAANTGLSDTAPTPPTGNNGGTLSISGRNSDDPPLPIGFQDQLFSTGTGPVTWSTTTPAIASVDANGIVTALAEGTAVIRVEDSNGATGTFNLPTRTAVAGSASYQDHIEFGQPVDGDASDDFIVSRSTFIASYSQSRGTPNWVSYNLDATHFGAEDRCDCFTHDPALPSSYTVLTTADYTGAGGYAGYGIDRGHLARSFDRTSGSLDNATTYYFSNIIPQAADNNQGPWAAFENEIGDRARVQNREVYVIAGVAGDIGTVKGEGKIVIPGSVWKVAVIMPRDEGVDDVDSASDIEVIAVMMPNVAGIRNTPWAQFTTTVWAIEQATGYDLLSALPDGIEAVVEARPNQAPVADAGSGYTGFEGSPVSISASGSVDPEGGALSFVWTLPSGQTSAGENITVRFAQDGSYTLQLVVTDEGGLSDTTTTVVQVANVAPAIVDLPDTALLAGETLTLSGAFFDPGADSWTATVDYGEGEGAVTLALADTTFALSHRYGSEGSYTVIVTISDGTDTTTEELVVTVSSAADLVRSMHERVGAWADAGRIHRGAEMALKAKLATIHASVQRDRDRAAQALIRTFIGEVRVFERIHRIDSEAAAELIADAERLLAVI